MITYFVVQPSLTCSFLVSRYTVDPSISDFMKTQPSTLLDVGLEVTSSESLSKLYIDGIKLELDCTPPSKSSSATKLPGCTGPQPDLSSGPLRMKTLSKGKFINVDGQQTVPFEQEAWEMVWINERPTGSIICGFYLPKLIQRNDAYLAPGHMYLNFRVWTIKGLHLIRNEKMAYERSLAKHMFIQDEEWLKMKAETNPIMKAVHFQKAAAANEMIGLMRTEKFNTVPMEDADTIHISKDLVVAKQGTMWVKGVEATLMGKKDTHYCVGSAILKGGGIDKDAKDHHADDGASGNASE